MNIRTFILFFKTMSDTHCNNKVQVTKNLNITVKKILSMTLNFPSNTPFLSLQFSKLSIGRKLHILAAIIYTLYHNLHVFPFPWVIYTNCINKYLYGKTNGAQHIAVRALKAFPLLEGQFSSSIAEDCLLLAHDMLPGNAAARLQPGLTTGPGSCFQLRLSCFAPA